MMKELEGENALACAKESSKKGRANALEIMLVEADLTIAACEATMKYLHSCLDHVEAAVP